jgi:exportin-2 (importin alpha re-exporter)
MLVQHLQSDNYVIYSYAAITIERILFIKVDRQALWVVWNVMGRVLMVRFTQADVRPFAENILMALFSNIEKGGTPEKIAENDYLMKCQLIFAPHGLNWLSGAMRVIIVARQSLTPSHEAILTRLVNILGEISKNPSNPKFNQYCFESVSALIRFVCDGTPGALPKFEQAIFGPAQIILANDVAGELLPTFLPRT